MRIAVFSDTHGVTDPMLEVVRAKQPDSLIHLGDYDRDAVTLLHMFPEIPLYSVAGNCDYVPLSPNIRIVSFGTVKAFLTHGHLYHVEYGHVDSLVYAAQEADAQLVLFGHTHIPMHENIGGIKIVNPGTAGKGKNRTWVMLTIFDNGAIGVEFQDL